MGLVVSRFEVRNFRSYEHFELLPDPFLTVLVGPNAVGKTNLIEGLQLLTAAESFRRPQWAELVRWGESEARLEMKAEDGPRLLETSLSITDRGAREFRVNEKVRRRLTDVAGVLPSVVFTPDDLRLLKDSAERRRTALDSLGVQLSPKYRSMKSEYERVVRQRNALIREENPATASLAAWDERLLEVGEGFFEARTRLFSRLSAGIKEAHARVAPESAIEPRYQPAWQRDGLDDQSSIVESLRAHLEKKRREEQARRTTLVGPHRDEIVFELDGRDARAFASQGQQRTIALAWKLAEVSVIQDVSGQAPLLLLDDVMSELDERRRHELTRVVGQTAQTIVTTTNIGYFEDELIERSKTVFLS